MLKITIPASEQFNQKTNEFIETKEQALLLEHSLVSISKWESKWKKPFLSSINKQTPEEFVDYVKCMTLTKNVDPVAYSALTKSNIDEIVAYINDTMTATWFKEDEKRPPDREVITAEVIYYWMIELNIPFECQKWHLNKLMTLIKVCNEKHRASENKMSKRDVISRNRSLNNARKKALHTHG